MALATPQLSIGTGMAVAAMSYGIFQYHLPPVVDVRTCDSHNRDIHASVKSAAWVSAAGVAAVSLITKDATVFVFGGAAILTLTWLMHHANAVSPITGTAAGPMYVDDIVTAQQDALPENRSFDPVI